MKEEKTLRNWRRFCPKKPNRLSLKKPQVWKRKEKTENHFQDSFQETVINHCATKFNLFNEKLNNNLTPWTQKLKKLYRNPNGKKKYSRLWWRRYLQGFHEILILQYKNPMIQLKKSWKRALGGFLFGLPFYLLS